MPETGQPGGGSRSRTSGSVGGLQATGSRGPLVKVLKGTFVGNVSRIIRPTLGIRWNIVSLYMKLVSDATVVSRYVRVEVQDEDGDTIQFLLQGDEQAASNTYYHQIGPCAVPTIDGNGTITGGEGPVATQKSLQFPFPIVDKMGVAMSVLNGVAGDVVSWRMLVMEWKQ